MTPTPDAKSAQPEQLVEEARQVAELLRAGEPGAPSPEWFDALATALSECRGQDRAATRMAAAIDVMVHARTLNSRSPAADARLDYGDPFPLDEAQRILAAQPPRKDSEVVRW